MNIGDQPMKIRVMAHSRIKQRVEALQPGTPFAMDINQETGEPKAIFIRPCESVSDSPNHFDCLRLGALAGEKLKERLLASYEVHVCSILSVDVHL